MSSFIVDERVRLSIEIALTVDGPGSLRQRQDADARRLGMFGAEIDAARRGYSFDAWTSVALALAIASRRGDVFELEDMRERARKTGVTERVRREIEEFAELVDSPHLEHS